MKKKINLIGYWNNEEENSFIMPQKLVDEKFYSDYLKKGVLLYLRKGKTYWSYLGYSSCRFEDGPPDEEMGSCDLTDGVWAWPEGLSVYVEKYNVKLPIDFISHIKRMNFKIHADLEIDPYDGDYKLDLNYWISWCKSHNH